jgi:hypothetical protein
MNIKTNNKIHYTLRIAIAMCFIGHGVFGIITKAVWCNYFGVVGIGKDLSYDLMPFVGIIDIFLGVCMLVWPMRAVPGWLVIWGMLTALLRPLSGEPFPEFLERAGNYGAPFALLLLNGLPVNLRGWFARLRSDANIPARNMDQTIICLQIVGFMLFLGHALLNLEGKTGLLNQYSALGFKNPADVGQFIGLIELAAAVSILIKPVRPLLIALLIWKMGSELFYPTYAVFEWIERGGSYGVILALWMALKNRTVPGFSVFHRIMSTLKLRRETE